MVLFLLKHRTLAVIERGPCSALLFQRVYDEDDTVVKKEKENKEVKEQTREEREAEMLPRVRKQ